MFNFVILFSVYHDLETRHKKTIINFYRKPPGSCILLFLVFLVFYNLMEHNQKHPSFKSSRN